MSRRGGFSRPARAPVELREEAKHRTFSQNVTDGSATVQCLLKRGDAFVVRIRDIALFRAALQQFSSQFRRHCVTGLQGTRVMSG